MSGCAFFNLMDTIHIPLNSSGGTLAGLKDHLSQPRTPEMRSSEAPWGVLTRKSAHDSSNQENPR